MTTDPRHSSCLVIVEGYSVTPAIPSSRWRELSTLLHSDQRATGTQQLRLASNYPHTKVPMLIIRQQLSPTLAVAIAVAVAVAVAVAIPVPVAITVPAPTTSDKPNTIHPGLLRQIVSNLLKQDVFGIVRRSSIQRCCYRYGIFSTGHYAKI